MDILTEAVAKEKDANNKAINQSIPEHRMTI